ncbi:GNAT family N-acetyltransferase [Microtetraspora sp. NBRC 16547]|uniref:GNAT family N-acetyltransferase n=1 Tax=Microtetraspora sp. NBRC 16547 TaxID=3030993 RepID=UPI002557AED3|nr:GNAT family N-acetyltransferase [Microtetraspora sp. NBRC 16547]
MNHDIVLAAFDRQMRQDVRPDGPEGRVERVEGVVRQVGPDHGWNGVVWSNLDHTTADAAIAAQVRYFTSIGREFEWKLYAHDRPDDLPGRLRAAGFVPEPEETLMVAEVSDLPTAVELPDEIRLLPVTDAAGAELMTDVHEQAFGTARPEFMQRFLEQLAEEPDTVAAAVAMAGDVPVSAARMEMHPGTQFASLWGGGTAPAWRGRGIYRALVAFRARIAAERGYRYLQVDASDQSRPILQRLGFVPLSTTTPYLYQP